MGRRPALVWLEGARGDEPGRARHGAAAPGAPAAGLGDGRGALRARHARGLPGSRRVQARGGGVERVGDRGDRWADGLRRACRPRGGPGPAGADAGEREARVRARRERFPLGGGHARPRAQCCRAPDGRGAVEQLACVRRGARAEALPPRRGGGQTGARAAPLPHRPRLPQRAPAGRGARAPAHRTRLGRFHPRLRAGGAERGDARPAHRHDRRGDRAHLPGPARGRAGGADRRARRGRARAAPPADPRGLAGQADPHARRLPPRTDHPGPPRLGGARLRGRAGAGADGAPPQAVAAPRRGGHDALVRVCGVGVGDPARRGAARGLGGAGARRVPRRLSRRRGPVAVAREPPRRGADAVGLRAREGGLRAALRAEQPPGLGADPGGGHLEAAGGAGAVTDLDLIARREHPDPHHVLGAHPCNGGVIVRAFRPAAERVLALPDGGEPVALEQRHPAGLFEGKLDGAELPLRYELEVSYPDGNTFTLRDPYSFPPTMGELDLHLAGEGRHEEIYSRLGAHRRELEGVTGTSFAVWAPAAKAVSVVGDFNSWDGRLHPMRSLGSSGIWEIFLPGVEEGAAYKYEILTQSGEIRMKADPFAFRTQVPPRTDSVVFRSHHAWGDTDWMERRTASAPHEEPISIYEVHLGSWRLNPREGNRSLSYAELGEELAAYVIDMGFTHVELLPVMEHPFSGSWGYQVSGYFAPTARHGTPDDFRALVDRLHQAGIGVILDWVPAHFPRDDWALARFDGSALYEHEDPRRGAHPEWGTLVFNYGRNEVRNFLLASALFWPREYHADGLRVDAVSFLKELNEVIHRREPGIVSAAEESTAWPGVSRPTYLGGLGFGFKWNMGWMHDTLDYFQRDPVHRRFHHHDLTFSMVYAWNENFVLPLSHDEVVHGKRSLVRRMPGDRWQRFANLRALYGYMWAHPGKQLLFMGCEFGQEDEWSEPAGSLDWHLLDDADHAGVLGVVRDL